ncbi:MAG: hypothetical protein RMY16_08425 [Nostoc sp. DedQUE12b]|uniref:hypothetical protein n=1 Tax=Nostoc sp. DedQUE12b TaxID=3075398 RepID=UPI002AD48867|nr:hypothetical protein [Nostoc sp. DedQUE12b]MDZ8085607.1 hypothetical protein [Nostoc sp. DedQUE12b]
MPENSLEVINVSSQNRIIPINRNKEKKTSSKFNKPHCIIPVDDIQWVVNQVKTVQTLWNECWASDQYGSRWMKLSTSLGDKAFRLARQLLYTTGLFEFKRETCTDDSRKTACWLVKNLHGARRIQEFWMKDDEQESSVNSDAISGINEPDISQKIPDVGQKMPDISPESIENTGVPEPLSNTSGTSQELLKEVHVDVTPTNELLEKVRSRGTKTAEKLAIAMERCMKKAAGEQPEQSFKELFISRYKWRIDDERFQKLIQLTASCTLSFFQKFKYVYHQDGMSAPRTFDKAIDLVIKNASTINEAVKLQLEAFNYQPTS